MTIALMEQDGGVGFQVVDHDSSMITDGKTHIRHGRRVRH